MAQTLETNANTPQPNGSENWIDAKKVGNRVIGKVASPPRRESTSEQFHFWLQRSQLVEKTQLVRTDGELGGKEVSFYGIVDEVYRQSRRRDIGQEYDAHDGDVNYLPPFATEGVSFALVSILRTDPPV